MNVLLHHKASKDGILVLVNVPLEDGAVAEAKVVLNRPVRFTGTGDKPEYSMKIDTNLTVTQTQRKLPAKTDLQNRDGLWWEIPVGYPGAPTVLLNHEPEVKEFLSSRFKRGSVFVDVGANVGAYSLRALSRGVTVYSFEPNPENVKLLKRNAEINDLSVHVLDCALGAAEAMAKISANGATSRIDAEIEGGGIDVPVRTLDSFQLPRVDLLKIDVEGYELEVLKGSLETLARCHPEMMIELHHWIGAEAEAAIFNILISNGYRFEYLDTYNQGRHLIAQPRKGPPREIASR